MTTKCQECGASLPEGTLHVHGPSLECAALEAENAKLRAEVNALHEAAATSIHVEDGSENTIQRLRAEVEVLKEQANAKNDLRAALAKSDLQVEELRKALALYGVHTEACWGQQSMVDKTCRCGLDQAKGTEKQDNAITICGWCAGTGKEGPSILEVPCRKCFGSGDPTKPTPGVQSS
jgi:hypothetical protein